VRRVGGFLQVFHAAVERRGVALLALFLRFRRFRRAAYRRGARQRNLEQRRRQVRNPDAVVGEFLLGGFQLLVGEVDVTLARAGHRSQFQPLQAILLGECDGIGGAARQFIRNGADPGDVYRLGRRGQSSGGWNEQEFSASHSSPQS
jgi:hypothetical protein